MIEKRTIYQVDAFTSEPFKGNPAAVCLTESFTSNDWMQNVAAEMNLSETAFIIRKNGEIRIRFFTPAAEVSLCGHATLSSAHILYEMGLFVPGDEIIFKSKAGDLKATKTDEWITLDFPAFAIKQSSIPQKLNEAIGVNSMEAWNSDYGWVLIRVGTEQEVREAKPDFSMMVKENIGHVMITAPSDSSEFDFVVRCFAPVIGIDEDPVTGSAHCALVPYWSMKTGNKDFISHQISKREGILKLRLQGDRVLISGQAKTIFVADLLI